MDLNADLGETEGDYKELLPIVTSANVACGAHAGGGQILIDTLKAAKEHSVKVGAHPSYPDRENFGRVSLRKSISSAELIDSIAEQIAIVRDEAEKLGIKLNHVKAHGALYNDAMDHEDTASAFLEAVARISSKLPVLGLPFSKLEQLAKESNFPFMAEGFIDRAYTPSLRLVPRGEAGAVLDLDQSLRQVRDIVTSGEVSTSSGSKIPLKVLTLCVHGDSPDAAARAKAVRHLLEDLGVEVQPFSAGNQ